MDFSRRIKKIPDGVEFYFTEEEVNMMIEEIAHLAVPEYPTLANLYKCLTKTRD